MASTGRASEPHDTRRRTVSVAMATYNGRRFLEDQLDSLRAQTRLPDELVVTDDGSSDGTLELLKDFALTAPFPVRISANPDRLGWSDNFTRAVRLCSGELIAPSDQDDVWQADKLERCAGWFERRPDLQMVVHSFRTVDAGLRAIRGPKPRLSPTRVLESGEAPLWFRHWGMAMVFHRRLIESVDPARRPMALDRGGSSPMHYDLWLCFLAAAAGPIGLLADDLVLYRRHSANVSTLTIPLGGTQGVRGVLDLPTKIDGYRTFAARCRAAADYLERLEGTFPFDRRILSQRAALHRRAAEVFDARAKAMEPGARRITRAARVVRMAARRSFVSRDLGGLGRSSLAFDLAVALAAPRRGAVHPGPG